MKKIVSVLTIVILSIAMLMGCSNKPVKDIDIIDTKELSSTSVGGNKEVLATIENYTNDTIEYYNIELISKDKVVSAVSYNKSIEPNSTVDVTVILPQGMDFADIELIVAEDQSQN